MQPKIESVSIGGFRSLADVKFTGLPNASVLIGANGAGKSNFMRFFEMMSWMLNPRRLADFVSLKGGADDQLFGGNRRTRQLNASIAIRNESGLNEYRFELTYGHPDRFIFTDEAFRFTRDSSSDFVGRPEGPDWQHLGSGHREAEIVIAARSKETRSGINRTTANTIVNMLQRMEVYQFHDTSDTSRFKISWDITDNSYLRSDGSNLAPILYRLKAEDYKRYEWICMQIERILPNFDDFVLTEHHGKIILKWKAKGVEKTLGAHLTSDGSLRFFALVTLLNLPGDMLPDVILLDEPELGLHPAAVDLLGGMINSMSSVRQVIVATQSPNLVDSFEVDEVFVLEMDEFSRTEVTKQHRQEFQVWLEDGYTPGGLWTANLLGGTP